MLASVLLLVCRRPRCAFAVGVPEAEGLSAEDTLFALVDIESKKYEAMKVFRKQDTKKMHRKENKP